MTRVTTLVTRHPVTAYFGLTFAISWCGVLMVIGARPELLPTGLMTVRSSHSSSRRCSPAPASRACC
jgi:hypothetical protein